MSCRIVNLRVDRAPGFREGFGPVLNDLEPGLNLIIGPNGSGKSTLARAALAVLTGRSISPGVEVLATVATPAGTRYLLWSRDRLREEDLDVDTVAPSAPAEGIEAAWIHLHLPDLLVGDEAEFVRQVAQELAGGIDLAGLRKTLAEPPSNQNSTPLVALRQARAAYQQACREQASGELQATLRELAGQVEEAETAVRDAALLERASNLAELRAQLASARARRDAAPSAERLLPADVAATKALRAARHKARQARQEVEAERVPPAGLRSDAPTASEEALVTAEQRLDSWKRAAEQAQHAAANAERARTDLQREHSDWRQLGGPAELPAAGQAVEFHALEALVRRQAELTGRHAAFNEWDRLLGPPEAAEVDAPNSDLLRRGRDILDDWLRAPWVAGPATAAAANPLSPSAPARKLAWAAAGGLLLAFSGLLAALKWDGWGFAVATAGVALAAGAGLALWRQLAAASSAPAVSGFPGRVDAQARYLERGLPPPPSWTDEAVRALRDRLDEEARTAADRATRRAARASRQPDLARIREEEAQLAADLAAARAALGAPTELGAAGLLDWLRCRQRTLAAAAAAAQTEIEAAQANAAASTARAQLVAALEALGLAPAKSHEEVTGQLQALRRWTESGRELRRAMAAEAEAEAALRDLVVRAGLAPNTDGDSTALDEAFTRAQQRWNADRDVETAERLASQEEARCPPAALPYADLAAGDLAAALAQAQAKAAAGKAARERLVEARAQEKAFADGDAITAALARLDQAQAGVANQRERWAGVRIARQALDWIEQTLQREHQPERVQAASEWLREFTHGQHELGPLRLHSAGQESGLRVIDTVLGNERRIEQLSSGTKVQLLLALRLAQGGERARTAPLILDETLAQADPLRAAAVMRALAALTDPAGAPRQLLVFTAQPEEATRWDEAAQRVGREVSHHYLGPAAARPTLPQAGGPVEDLPPAPVAEESAATYATRLQKAGAAPAPDPLTDPDCAGWAWWGLPTHLTHDLVRYRLITHGAWRNAPASLRERVVPDPAWRRHLSLLAEAWRLAVEAWREGRACRRVTPADLEDVPQIGNQARHTLEDELAPLHWDPLALLQRLESVRIAGIGKGRVDSLRSTWLERGILRTDSPALGAEALHQRLLGILTADPNVDLADAEAAVAAALRWLPMAAGSGATTG